MAAAGSSSCVWDATELLLKASVENRDAALCTLWVRAYLKNMVCFPRLNVISDNITHVAHRFANVPNVSFHQIHWPQPLLDRGLGHSIYSKEGAKKLHGLPAVYFAIQWPLMWADNFTVARHILVLDTDTLPVLPLRCHHLFDDDERPIWHTWAWPKPAKWLPHVNGVFNQTIAPTALSFEEAHLAPHADFMTFFPIVIPRAVLQPARDAVTAAYNSTHFDEAWIRMKNPSYADILGKAAALLRPGTIRVVHCPPVGRRNELIPVDVFASMTDNACRDHLTAVEHLKHPFRDCHTGGCHHLSRTDAVQYGVRLFRQGEAFVQGKGPLPKELYHYQTNRSVLANTAALEAQLTREDQPGRVCGMPSRDEGASSASSGPSELHVLGHDASDELALLIYDNKFNSSLGPSPRHLLYRSAAALGVPVLIGSLVPAAVRRWMPGDREKWLMATLPRMTAKLVVLLDGFDTVLQCRVAELADVWRRQAGKGRILITTEKQLWPEEGAYRGERLIGIEGAYPKADPVNASRYINIGGLVGTPADQLALLQCMSTRYASFPYQCPIRDLPNGSYEYVSTAPFRTRRFGTVRGHWGWEQACFHTYLAEQAHGALPSSCPHLVLDYRAEFALNFNKIGPKLVWPWADAERMLSPFTKAASCVLHANGAGKYAMPVLHFWYDHVHAPDRQTRPTAAAIAKADRAELLRNFSREYVSPWVQALKPQLLRESSAILMMKDALRTLPVSTYLRNWQRTQLNYYVPTTTGNVSS